MPYMTNGKRDYKKENREFNSKPSEKKKRAARNQARAEAERDGRVSKGDGKDLDHKKPLSKGGSNNKSNTRVVSQKANRSFKRNKDGSMK